MARARSEGGDTVTHEPAARPGGFYLLVVGAESSRRVPLPRAGVLIAGRSEKAELRIDEETVSREHAAITVADGEVRVRDLDSHNGTRVNGERIAGTRTLLSGDAIAIGNTTIVVHCAPTAPAERTLGDATELRRRIDEEVNRSERYGRRFSLLVVEPAGAEAARMLSRALRRIDVAGALRDGALLVLLPELDGGAASATAARLLSEMGAPAASPARAGYAVFPDDGCDGDTLLAAARAALAAAPPGEVAAADAAGTRVPLGERALLIADPAMARLFELVRRLAPRDLPVLVTGETGVGKEHAALALHLWSPRAASPFVVVNCAALPESLVESELFGHEKGAFSGATSARAGYLESATGGTLLLDEIGEVSLAVQAKLLRAVETRRIVRVGDVRERKIDVRIVAATHRALDGEVRAGRFRQDLYFRLCAAVLQLPPLRERPLDVPRLARLFLDEACGAAARSTMSIAPPTMLRLARYAWPGNVRELKHAMEWAAASATGDVLLPHGLPAQITAAAAAEPEEAPAAPPPDPPRTTAPTTERPGRPLNVALREFERARIEEALDASGGNQSRAAELLGLPLRTLVYKLRQLRKDD